MKRVLFFTNFIFLINFLSSQTTDSIQLKEVSIYSLAPTTKQKITSKELEKRNLAEDLTFLIKNSTSVLTTSETGIGIGYTGIRVRGTDPTRINVTLNDVPINDSESQAVFWVNMPDLTTSVSSINIQRGVGTSTNGTSSFGASVGIQTKENADKMNFMLSMSQGSFDTQKYSFRGGSGKIGKYFSIDGGISHIQSDGYVNRARAELFSYNFKVNFKNEKNEITYFNFGGKEKTYQAWYGIDKETMKINRTRNFAGEIYDENYNVMGTYDNQTDNYKQNHHHLTWNRVLSNDWNLKTIFHYTKGKGYYEEYHNKITQDEKEENLKYYNINSDLATSDLVRQKWLNNDFYGTILQLNGKINELKTQFGLVANQYYGRHFGKVIWVKDLPNYSYEKDYYYNTSLKSEISSYAKAIYTLNDFEFFADAQVRYIDYSTKNVLENINLEGDISLAKTFLFFNPKAGISYKLPNGKLYFSYAIAHREPTRTDFLDGNKNATFERLDDYEIGINQKFNYFNFNTNLYYMNYTNQLVLTGRLDDVGNAIRENAGKGYRLGIEQDLNISLTKQLSLFGNFNASINKILDYVAYDGEILINHGTTNTAFSPNFITNYGVEFAFLKDFYLRFSNQYVAEQYLDNTNNEQAKLPNYTFSDLNFSYTKKFIKNHELSINLLINNIFNSEYSNNAYRYDGVNYFYPQAGRHFFAGMSFKF